MILLYIVGFAVALVGLAFLLYLLDDYLLWREHRRFWDTFNDRLDAPYRTTRKEKEDDE